MNHPIELIQTKTEPLRNKRTFTEFSILKGAIIVLHLFYLMQIHLLSVNNLIYWAKVLYNYAVKYLQNCKCSRAWMTPRVNICSVRVPSQLVWWRCNHSSHYTVLQCCDEYGVIPCSLLIWAQPAVFNFYYLWLRNYPETTSSYPSKRGVN